MTNVYVVTYLGCDIDHEECTNTLIFSERYKAEAWIDENMDSPKAACIMEYVLDSEEIYD